MHLHRCPEERGRVVFRGRVCTSALCIDKKLSDEVRIPVKHDLIPQRHMADVLSKVMRVNLDAVFVLARDIGAYMLTRLPGKDSPHRGSIINVASLVSFQGGLNVPAYAAAKGGVAQLTKSLSNQWASRGINVNAVRCSFAFLTCLYG